MTKPIARKLRCAVYTRKPTEEGLQREVDSLHAQREACEAYVASQRSEAWALIREPPASPSSRSPSPSTPRPRWDG